MKSELYHSARGSAVVALLLVAVLILGSMLMLHTAAITSIQNTSRAMDVARENAITVHRVERATREAAQQLSTDRASLSPDDLKAAIGTILKSVDVGSAEIDPPTISAQLRLPMDFPDWNGPVAPLSPPSDQLICSATPVLRQLLGTRVAETASAEVAFAFHRKVLNADRNYPVSVTAQLVAVPLSRFGLMLYDLPSEIGLPAKEVVFPHSIDPVLIAPSGLVPSRDRANRSDLSTGTSRPEHYRYLAALSSTYQYVFSAAYLQRITDYAGATHYIQIGAGSANPRWSGGTEKSGTYYLDIGEFGDASLGSTETSRPCAVICATSSGSSLHLSDDGSKTSAVLLAIAGPADLKLPPLDVVVDSAILRPVVLVCYHVQLLAGTATSINGALLLDRDSAVSASAGPFTVGHLSCWAGQNGLIALDSFRLVAMDVRAEALAPRVVYAVTSKTEM